MTGTGGCTRCPQRASHNRKPPQSLYFTCGSGRASLCLHGNLHSHSVLASSQPFKSVLQSPLPSGLPCTGLSDCHFSPSLYIVPLLTPCLHPGITSVGALCPWDSVTSPSMCFLRARGLGSWLWLFYNCRELLGAGSPQLLMDRCH